MSVRVGIVGSGFGLYGLLPAFQRLSLCSVVGLCGRQTDRLVGYCRQTSVPAFSDWRQMLDETKPDALAVAVVPQHQFEVASEALQRNVAIFAEKPLAATLQQAVELQRLAAAKRVANMVDFLFPEISEWQKTKELISGDEIGEVRHLSVDWSFLSYDVQHKTDSWKLRSDQGGGALSFYCSHVFYSLEFFLGAITSLSCSFDQSREGRGAETAVKLRVLFRSGQSADVSLNCACSSVRSQLWRFEGQRGALELRNSVNFTSGFELLRTAENGRSTKIPVLKPALDKNVDERVPLVASLGARFISWIENGPNARPDFTDGVRVQRLIEAARHSAARNAPVLVD